MDLKAEFTSEDISRYLDKAIDVYTEKMIRVLRFVGEQAVAGARSSQGNYTDRTGNLRSSVGYIITLDGVIQEQNFSGNSEGSEIGKQRALEALGNEGVGIAVVAGMNYAASVESKGYNVLTTAEQFAKVKVPQLLSQLV